MTRRTKNSSAAGMTPMMNTVRQPYGGMTKYASSAASARPSGNAANMLPVIRPRMRLGLYSAVSVNATGTSPPKPKFEMKRKMESDNTFHEVATNPVNTEKIPIVAANDVRRPM